MKISVVIPIYNSKDTIVECVNSVVRECIENPYSWELIMVDDGSKDESVDIIKNYIAESKYSEHFILVEQANGGAAVARNTGIGKASGEFIAFNDSDDKWLEGKLKVQMDYLINNEDVVMLAGIYSTHNMSSIKTLTDFNHITIKDQVLKNYFSPPTTIIRKSILEKSGLFDETTRYLEEGLFFNNIVYNGKSVLMNRVISEPVVHKFSYGQSGLSGNLWKMECGELFNLKQAYKLKYISLGLYFKAYCFSITKFIRRFMISKTRKV